MKVDIGLNDGAGVQTTVDHHLSDVDVLRVKLARHALGRTGQSHLAHGEDRRVGVAATHNQKERAFKVIQKYSRLKDQCLIEERYTDLVKFLERIPRVEPEAIAPIVEFMGKKPIAVETIADNSIVDRLVREGFIDKLFKQR